MSFHLKRKQGINDGIKRNVKRQVKKALARLHAKEDPDATVYEVRKCFKRIRAALRLVRDELGDTVYRQENILFRDAARPLAAARDVVVLVETFDNLANRCAPEIKAEEFCKVRKLLAENGKAVTRHVLAAAADAIEPVLKRLDGWTIHREGWASLHLGLQRMYQKGKRALAACLAEASVENLHEWRKQAKYLWHGLQFLKLGWTGEEKKLGGQVHDLTRLLGEDHDLAVLRQMLGADPLGYGGRGLLEVLFCFIKRRREDLQRQAFLLGQAIYRDSPTAFSRRMGDSWKAGNSSKEHEPQEIPKEAAVQERQ